MTIGILKTRLLTIIALLTACLFSGFISSLAQAQDTDSDGFQDAVDNCITVANGVASSNQRDVDLDGFGNACDGDFDNDGVVAGTDFIVFSSCLQNAGGPPDDPNCEESDMDNDGVVAGTDFILFQQVFGGAPGPSGLGCADASGATAPCFNLSGVGDTDGDGVANSSDNCALAANPPFDGVNQLDADLDGIGNHCDGDFDNDGIVSLVDFGSFQACFGGTVPGNGPAESPTCAEIDMNGDGFILGNDFSLFSVSFGGIPGPSGLTCANATATNAPCLVGGQQPDVNYIPVLANPRYTPETAPVVAVDTTHANFHTIDNRYTGFARLLRADGYVVQDFSVPFAPGCVNDLDNCLYFQELLSIDTLVISNATTVFSVEEAALITGWLSGALGCPTSCSTRRLFLIADHQRSFNFPLQIRELSLSLGMNWPNNNVSTRQFTLDPPYHPVSGGILNAIHPIIMGSSSNESIVSVTTFFGSGFIGPVSAIPEASVLTLPPGASTTGTEPTADAEGFSQGMAFSFGSGRVFASGEAAMFTAQATRFGGPFGMHTLPLNNNQQYLLNLMHWLDGEGVN